MPPKQTNAIEVNPNALDLTVVAEYTRRIDAPVERVWENVLDWEHLPHLHASSFDTIELDEAGDWGWRTFSDEKGEHVIELVVDRAQSRYVSRTFAGERQRAEVWTELSPLGHQTDIRVTFQVPDADPSRMGALRENWLRLYAQLWNEDEAMMVARHHRLTLRDAGPEVVQLDLDAIVMPHLVTVGESDWWVTAREGTLRVYSAVCPHLLGPLTGQPADDGSVGCPWHGYRFDVESRQCLAPTSSTCRLPRPPELHVDGSLLTLTR